MPDCTMCGEELPSRRIPDLPELFAIFPLCNARPFPITTEFLVCRQNVRVAPGAAGAERFEDAVRGIDLWGIVFAFSLKCAALAIRLSGFAAHFWHGLAPR